jgi:hypothetical protein
MLAPSATAMTTPNRKNRNTRVHSTRLNTEVKPTER